MRKKRVKKLKELYFEKFGYPGKTNWKGGHIKEINEFRRFKKDYNSGLIKI